MRRLALVLLLAATPAFARSEKTLAYARDQVWPPVVRFVVVDEHLKITEKDPDAGYILFELRDEGKTYRGSVEVMTIERDGRRETRFVIQIEDRPSWMELAMLSRLEKKLRSELGSPNPTPTPPPKPEPKPEPRPDPDAPPVSPTP